MELSTCRARSSLARKCWFTGNYRRRSPRVIHHEKVTEIPLAEQMPVNVRCARFVMTLQVAFSLVGLALLMVPIAGTGSLLLVGLLVLSGVLLAIIGRLMGRWHARRRRRLWAVLGVELFWLGQDLVMRAIDHDFSWQSMIMPAVVIVLLSPPPSWRWFNRPAPASPLMNR
jgi:hypothetical protein